MKTDTLACKWKCLGIASFFFFYQRFLQYWGNSGQKKYFTDRWTANIVICCCKNFFGLLFSSKFGSEGKFPRDYLLNVAICLFTYHENWYFHQKCDGMVLLIMCKVDSLTRSTNLISGNHPTLCFWLRKGRPKTI